MGEGQVKHDWEVSERLGAMKIEDTDFEYEEGGGEHVLMASEAERLIEELSRFELSNVGSSRWLTQHAAMEKLNQQAHASARDKSDEFVLEGILTYDKLQLIIYDLILSEAWRDLMYPRLKSTILGEKPRTLRAYFVLYHEATLVNLLEVICFHGHAVSAMKDAAVDLIDYCARRLAVLQGRAEEFRKSALLGRGLAPPVDQSTTGKEAAERIAEFTPEKEMERQLLDIEFSVSVACIGVLRYLCQHLGDLSVSAAARLLDHHDMLLSVVPLIENPPWTRMSSEPKTKKRIWQKFQEGAWRDVRRDRLLQVTKVEAQAWLALYALVMHPQIQKRYGFDAFRKTTLLRARKYLNDIILDQIPALADLQRFMDQLAIADAPEPTALGNRASAGLLLEQVAALRHRAVGKQDLDKVAQCQIKDIWGPHNTHLDKDLGQLVGIYSGPDVDGDEQNESVNDLLERLRLENKNQHLVDDDTKSTTASRVSQEENENAILKQVSSRPLVKGEARTPLPSSTGTRAKPLVEIIRDKEDDALSTDQKSESKPTALQDHKALSSTKAEAQIQAIDKTEDNNPSSGEKLPAPPPRSKKPLIVEIEHRSDQPIVEDITPSPAPFPPKAPLAEDHEAEVASIELQLRDKAFPLERQADVEAKIIPSPDGRHFQRVKWIPSAPLYITFRDSLALCVRFDQQAAPKLLSLDLYGELSEQFEPPPMSKLWQQLGDVEDNLAAQLFLTLQTRKPSDTCPTYKVSSVYLSTPISIVPGISSPD